MTWGKWRIRKGFENGELMCLRVLYGYRISRDREKRLQACLIPWEELEDLSRRENAVTGGQVDYPQMDRNNILILSRVLKARKEAEGKPHGSVSV